MSTCQSSAPSDSGCHDLPAREPMAVAPGAQPFHITDAVVDKVAELLAEENDPALRLRIYVTGGGCSGFQYGFAFDDVAQEDDVCVARGPVTVVVDAMSLQYLAGAEIDYEDKLEGARFVIHNPNATTTCGCGSSFSV